MTRLGLRLTLASGREALVRLVAIATAVGIGVCLLLTSLAGIHAVHAQAVRTAWLTTSKENRHPSVDEATADPLWALARLDQYGSAEVERVDLAPTGPRSPVPPGIPHLPRAGEYYASPALARLLESTPRSQLADRFPGRLVGTIGSNALASPDSFVIVIGHSAEELSQVPGATEIRSFETAGQRAPGDPHPGRMQLILAVVAGALLIPVLLFIGAASRLAAARREQRFAAMRLVGAAPSQVSVVAAVEASVAAVLGVLVGFVMFFCLRPLLATVPFTGEPFFHNDLSLRLRDVLLVAIGVPLAAVAAARLSLRRVQISPLGVTRQAASPDPAAWRIIPLAAGIAELAFFVGRRPSTTTAQIRAFGAGFLLAMIGLLVAGPWVTMVGARLKVRRARRPSTLIAGRRLAANPRAAFRAVSGLIVALFVSSAALGVISTILAYHSTSTGGAAGRNILIADVAIYDITDRGPRPPRGVAVPDGLLTQVGSRPGVLGVAAIHANPAQPAEVFGPPDGLVACADLAPIPALGHCAEGATVAMVPVTLGSGGVTTGGTTKLTAAQHVWPAATTPAGDLAALPVMAIDVGTNGSTAAIEQARTALELAFPTANTPTTMGDISAANAQLIAGWRQLAEVAIIASLVIAACSLAVSVASSLIDRKRPFSLLRLTGTPLAVLDRVVGLEAGLPLVLVAIAAAATGLLAAHLFLRAQLNESLQPPGPGYYIAVAAGVGSALGIIAATLPLLRRITGPETARNE